MDEKRKRVCAMMSSYTIHPFAMFSLAGCVATFLVYE